MNKLRQPAAMFKDVTGDSYKNDHIFMELKEKYNRRSKKTILKFYRITGLIVTSFIAILLLVAPAHSSFIIANKSIGIDETKPVVAGNTQNGGFFAAYLEEIEDTIPRFEVRVKRFNASGQQQGDVIVPFYPHVALSRPSIAYNPIDNHFIVAAPVEFFGQQDIWISFFDPAGTLIGGLSNLFSELGTGLSYCEGDGHSSLHMVHNTVRNEFVMTAQWMSPSGNGVWAQRFSLSSGKIDSPIQLLVGSTCIDGSMASHSIAYAPYPSQGRYLLVSGRGVVRLFDEDLSVFTGTDYESGNIPFEFGHDGGNAFQLDVAYGTVEGRNRFLIVYANTDNCYPNLSTDICPDIQDQRKGVWGLYIDPERLDYHETEGPTHVLIKKDTYPTPFPITYIYNHWATESLMKPQVDYCNGSQAFAVVWREIPNLDPQNDVNHSHIRGAWVDRYVEDAAFGDSLDSLYGMPPENIVLSEITPNSCTDGCYSNQDPDFPDVAPAGNGTSVAVWHQNYTYIGTTLDVRGALFPILSQYAGDFNHDSDVDGTDLAALVVNINLINLHDFAEDFGKTN